MADALQLQDSVRRSSVCVPAGRTHNRRGSILTRQQARSPIRRCRLVESFILRVVTVATFVCLAGTGRAGPVDIYLDGPQLCPRDQPRTASPITEVQAIARTRTMLP